jgi:hypothetical protein
MPAERRPPIAPMRAFALLMAFMLAGCTQPVPSPEAAATWVAVYGPADWSPPEQMSLEIGATAWSITPDAGGGVVTAELTERAGIRLVGLDGCHLYATFDAVPGSAHVIRFAVDGSVQVEDITGGALDAGPGLVESAPSDC